jgi:ATP-dependent RNA helicase DDX27
MTQDSENDDAVERARERRGLAPARTSAPVSLDQIHEDDDSEVDGDDDKDEEEEGLPQSDDEVSAESDDDDDDDNSEEVEDDDDDDDEDDEEQVEKAMDYDDEDLESGPREQSGRAASTSTDLPARTTGTRRAGKFFAETPTGTKFQAQSFADLGLSRPLVRACATLGYTHPTPIQAACIPLAMSGRDICGSAMTGSGKTAAFSLPILERLMHRDKRHPTTYLLVLTPTRELAAQIHSMVSKLSMFTDIRCALVVGGLNLRDQEAQMRTRPEIVIATPGRMIDLLMNSRAVDLDDLAALVLDEADRLLEMGFMDAVKTVVKLCPRKRQTLLFSATMTDQVRR